ncbi:uncharacterized protein I303_107606 [Kwoniella dejecticola CBS 10117]|uniref:SUZ domain-containing protein n=1 Tax=Kwoniella dejecticola CBS 10117 TaxID=1296121 RepID=A0A1A5ZV73_9TREE|nr:uncharacterized protein I303_07617 [Kwoniella dejecticola CBS 10117]OBR81707.1 hypothetical protein I303_07617 [Kwoniella dejecticola CBS 10117]
MGSNIEEDDWETADISLPPSKSKPLAPPLPTLRPQAQAFQPRPAQPPSSRAQSQSFSTPGQRNHPQPQASSSRQPMLLKRDTPSADSPKNQETNGDADGDGDDWFRGNKPQSNRQIWDSANARSAQPQIIAPQPLPGPKLQLLRRPSPGPNTSSNAPKENNKPKTLGEREEQYRLARERIFGPSPSASTSTPNPTSSSNANANEEDTNTRNGGGGGGGRISRGSSTEGKRRNNTHTPQQHQNQPQYTQHQNQYHQQGKETSWEGLVPSQIRSGSNTPNPNPNPNSNPRKTPDSRYGPTRSVASGGGVVRQPLGPSGTGVGFGYGTGTGFGGSPTSSPGGYGR